jgi:hypothetical protein
MSDNHTENESRQDQPPTEGGSTAPQDVDNPGERTAPAASGDQDQRRMDNAAEDRERTIAK